MYKREKTIPGILSMIVLILVVSACSEIPELGKLTERPSGGNSAGETTGGKNYVLLKRVRWLDEMGFDQPVEAGSLLLPEGWRLTGGVRWKGVNECRGEIVQQEITITSPDGEVELHLYPTRSFVYADDEMMLQTMRAGERGGGCKVSPAFDAARYVERFASDELNASVENVTTDSERERTFREMNEKIMGDPPAGAPRVESNITFVQADLKFADGKQGTQYVGVNGLTGHHPNYFSGGTTTSRSTTVFYNVIIKFPPGRDDDAKEIFALVNTSSKVNPIWEQAKTDFLTKLGNIEHAGRMERIRLVGEQSKAYARSRDQAMDDQMRSWERQQDASDSSHRRFVKTIREVDTWKSSTGDNVDLNSGYKYGWSKPDGSYILTDDPNFDPAIKLRQNWEKMEKQPD